MKINNLFSCAIIPVLLLNLCLFGKDWIDWPSTNNKDENNLNEFAPVSITWNDAKQHRWTIIWKGNKLQVCSPTSKKTFSCPLLADKEWHDPDSLFSTPSLYYWSQDNWECYALCWIIRGVDMGRNDFVVIALDKITGKWALCQGRSWGENAPNPAPIANGIRLEWEDETSTRFINVNQAWEVHTNQHALSTLQAPDTYRVVIYYAVLGCVTAQVSARTPLKALHRGMKSFSWQIASMTPTGGIAHSAQSIVYHHEAFFADKQSDVHSKPVLFFPNNQDQPFLWSDNAWLFQKGKAAVVINRLKIIKLASQGKWDIVLEKAGQNCEVLGLVER